MTLRFYTTEKLGTHQAVTPEGFLLCQNVPIARIGTMLYADGEVPIPADRDGLIRIHRDPEDVFSPMAIASFNGKPVTNDHPSEKVSPDNWRNYAIGTVLNPRRGDGLVFDNDFLFADLLITDTDAIGDIRQKRKREVSAGYDAEYEEMRPGEGRQHLIVGNHVALVDKGRCGPSCFIGDQEMASKRRFSLRDALMNDFSRRVMDAYRSKDEAALVMELERVTGMLGDILSGASEDGGFAGNSAPENGYGGAKKATDTTTDEGGIHIHMHGGSGMDDEGTPPPAAPPGGVDPAAATADPGAGDDLGQGDIEQRVAALERAVAILARADEGGGDEADPDGDGDDDFGNGGGDDDNPQTTDSDDDSDDEDDKPTNDRRRRRATGDRRRATVGDSTSLKPVWTELLSRAEFLAPGIKHPTFDAARGAKQTFDAMCNFRRKALKEGLKEDDTATVIKGIAGKKVQLDQMTCDAVTMLFNGASDRVRQANGPANQGSNGRPLSTLAGGTMSDAITKINERNLAFYAKPH